MNNKKFKILKKIYKKKKPFKNLKGKKKKEPGCTGRKQGRSHISGGNGLLPLHSYTPSTYKFFQ